MTKVRTCRARLVRASLLAVMLLLIASHSNALALAGATIHVNSTENKTKPGDRKCTLREAIKNANADADLTAGDCAAGSGGDIIVLGKKQKYSLAVVDNSDPGQGGNGLPWITTDMTIRGRGSTITRKGDAPAFRIFWVEHAGLTLDNVRVTNGNAKPFPGGAIFMNGGAVNVRNSVLDNNEAEMGGAIWNGGGTLMVSYSRFSYNQAEYGGAIRVEGGVASANTSISVSSFDHNTGNEQAGALYDHGTLSVTAGTFSNNAGGAAGGALYLYQDDATISVVTFTGNIAEDGGAVSNDANTATYKNVTISGNTSSAGGAFSMQVGTTSLVNTIIASQASGQNCTVASGTMNDNGGNLRFPNTDASCVGTFADPLLAALADNGGPTLTMLPQAGSAAIDQGDNVACAPIAGTNVRDQRGVVRPQNGDGSGGNDCDIGAVEVCATAPPKPVVNGPADGQVVTKARVTLDWEPYSCATEFSVQVRSGSKAGPVVWQKKVLYSLKNTDPASYEVRTGSLPTGATYFWRVAAHNEKGSTGSVWRSFVRR